jgi:serine/threonine-protein kinase
MSQMQALIGEKLGSYRIESVLGSGAMGVVYRGTDEKRGRPAAVKVVSGEIARGGKVQKRFEREAEILQQFRHPNIVRFLAWGKFRGTWYIAMEFIQGTTLEKMLQEGGALPWREAVDLMIQVCDALHYAHERGVVHRDLKPSNLMVTEDHRVKLTDFGIAKDLDRTSLTATGRTLGTAAYMAPEQIRGTPAVSHKTDLYALGAVLYQILVGRAPFEGTSPVVLMHCHLNEPAPRPSAKVQEIPRALDDLVVALMAKAPADRPWDAAAVGVILTELRDKAVRGERIPMVWPTPGSAEANPPRAGAVPAETPSAPRPKKKARKATILSTLTGSFFTTRSRATRGETDEAETSRAGLETLLLLAALAGLGGLIVYLVWPPGQEALYKRAEALMASSHRSDWITARNEYLEPLDRRFPNNPYREQTTRWRDKILLDEAESRADILAAPVRTKFSQPNTDAERKFVIAQTVAAEASRRGDDLAAVEQWKDLASKLKPDDKDERPWHLLARDHAEKLEAAIHDRRRFVEEQFRLADEAMRTGRTNHAIAIRSKLVEQYAGYTDLADLFPGVAAQPGAGPSSSGSPSTPARGGAVPGNSPSASEPGKPATPPAPGQAPPARPEGAPPPPSTESPAESELPADDAPRKPKRPDSGEPKSLPNVNQQFDSEFRS